MLAQVLSITLLRAVGREIKSVRHLEGFQQRGEPLSPAGPTVMRHNQSWRALNRAGPATQTARLSGSLSIFLANDNSGSGTRKG